MKFNLCLVFIAVVWLTFGLAGQNTLMASNIAANEPPQNILETIPEQITMADAMALAINRNPSLKGFSAEIRARDGAALQAGLRPNPELGVELENFGGNNSLRGFKGAETTIAYSQLVERGGKRKNRRLVATLDRSLAEWDYQSKKLDVLAATAKAFFEVLIAQQQVALNDELLKLAEQTTTAVSEKADAGKVSPVEKSRAQIELAAAQIEANKAVRELEAARRRLASFWGADRADFGQLVGQLNNISVQPAEESFKEYLRNNPDLARWATEIERSNATLRLARSEAKPDLTWSAGIRNSRETNENAFLIGISMPLASSNRNQGGISESKARIDKAHSEHQAAKISLETALSDVWQNLSAAYTEAITLRDEILPGAQSTYEATELGYRKGKLDFLQMLDAQRTLFTVKRQYLLSLGTYHLANTDMERLVGVPLSDIINTNKD